MKGMLFERDFSSGSWLIMAARCVRNTIVICCSRYMVITPIALFIHLFALSNPIGALPVFLSVTSDMSPTTKKQAAILTGLSVALFTLLFLWLGQSMLMFFGITVSDFKVAGGIVLVLMGLHMLQGENSPVHHDAHASDKASSLSVAFVPLCMPMIAGPGVLSTVISAAGSASPYVFSAVCVGLGTLVAVLFTLSEWFEAYLSPLLLSVLSRVLGLVIMSIAVSMLISGLKSSFSW